jgi:acyl-CoA thioesterase-1
MMRILATLAVCGLAAAGCTSSGVTPGDAATRIVVLGDSLAISPRADLAFPAVLQSRLSHEAGTFSITSVSANGATTADGLARLDDALADHPAILIVELGANDGLQGIDVGVIRTNLATIINRAKAAGADVVLCSMETTPFHGLGYFSEFRDLFPALGRQYGIDVTPFILGGVIGDPNLTVDLVHPNGKGAERVADAIWPTLQNHVRARQSPAIGSMIDRAVMSQALASDATRARVSSALSR